MTNHLASEATIPEGSSTSGTDPRRVLVSQADGASPVVHFASLANAYQLTRVGVSIAVFIVCLPLAVAWQWNGGYLVSGLAVAAAFDAERRRRATTPGSAIAPILLDATAIGLAEVLAQLPIAVFVAPLSYVVVSAFVLLGSRQALRLLPYPAAWILAGIAFIGTSDWTPGRLWLISAAAILIYAAGMVGVLAAAARALEHARLLDHQLRASQERLQTAITGTRVILFQIDSEGVFTLSEGAGLSALGLQPGEVVGTSAFEMYAEVPSVIESLERGLRGETFRTELQVGDVFFEVQYTPLTDEHGNVEGVIGMATDVTDRRQAEDSVRQRLAIEELVARLSTYVMSLPSEATDEGIAECLRLIAEFANADRSYVYLFDDGGTRAHNTHEWCKPGTESARPNRQNLVLSDHARISGPILAGEIVEVTDSAELPTAAHSEAMGTPARSLVCAPMSFAGNRLGMIGLSSVDSPRTWSTDHVAVLRIAGEMIGGAIVRRRALERLESLIHSKDEFVATIAHELRTPLTVVVGLAEELRTGRNQFTEDETQEFIGMIAEQSHEVAAIVEDLLVAARAEIGRVSVVPEAIDLDREIGGVVQECEHLRPADSAFEILDGDPVTAWADPRRFRQILRNLISNAFRYGGSNVTVVIGRHGAQTRIQVIDDGPGIAESEQSTIFEPFRTAHSVPGKPGSMGLGLAVARELATMMGGSLNYSRTEGESVFELLLPAATGRTGDTAA